MQFMLLMIPKGYETAKQACQGDGAIRKPPPLTLN